MPNQSLKRVRWGARKEENPDIIGTYYRLFTLDRTAFETYVPLNVLEATIYESIKLSLENPLSGEAHRIWNRLIGKPKETQLSLKATVNLEQSGLFQAITAIREQFGNDQDIKMLEKHTEDRIAIEDSLLKNTEPPKQTPDEIKQEILDKVASRIDYKGRGT